MDNEKHGKLKFQLVEESFNAKIRVIGIGGGGGNALNRMIEAGINGVDFIAVNTDVQALDSSRAAVKIQIGPHLTKGLGSGGRPETGKAAAMEDTEKLIELLEGSDMIFLTAGLGGGTGTGATPIIANLAAELDILCVAICTLPFEFEGRQRARQAQEGLNDLKSAVDTVIAIPNERLLQTVSLDTSMQDAFRIADDVLRQAVQGVSDLITTPGIINLDFADVRSIMKGMGVAFMGTGLSAGQNRAAEAANKAISSPLLIDTTIQGAKGILINITGGKDLTLHEVQKANQLIHKLAHPEANIIFGAIIDPAMKEMVKVTVIATGFEPGICRDVSAVEEAAAARTAADPVQRRTPAPFLIRNNTPPFEFEPKGTARPETPAARPAPRTPHPSAFAETDYENFETPAFIRNKSHQLRKYPS
ncbi:MAG: cell division protein FtsZ [Candidatus Aminicenantes bacterium]|nr:cell division protein FtsZ [Candidatus Aminicenantes bacterium]